MGNLFEVRALSDHLWHGDSMLVLGDVCALDKRVHRITETTPNPSQIRVRVKRPSQCFFFLIVEKGRFSTVPFRFEKFES